MKKKIRIWIRRCDAMKRILDIFIALLVIVLFLPCGLIIAVVLKCTGEGEIFYCQDRVGKGQKIFKIFKFATMLKASPSLGAGTITVKNDPRILPMGHFLRKTKLNEFPQFLNVLIGTMSMVGPRPMTPKNFSYYSEADKNIIGSLTPGITGLGSIYFRDEEQLLADKTIDENINYYKDHIAPVKAQLEGWYHEKRNVFLDIKILWMTFIAVIAPRSALVNNFCNAVLQQKGHSHGDTRKGSE